MSGPRSALWHDASNDYGPVPGIAPRSPTAKAGIPSRIAPLGHQRQGRGSDLVTRRTMAGRRLGKAPDQSLGSLGRSPDVSRQQAVLRPLEARVPAASWA